MPMNSGFRHVSKREMLARVVNKVGPKHKSHYSLHVVKNVIREELVFPYSQDGLPDMVRISRRNEL